MLFLIILDELQNFFVGIIVNIVYVKPFDVNIEEKRIKRADHEFCGNKKIIVRHFGS
ncbi:MAG: hypothetical protein LUE24_13765 [Lachnospiraceae bacterium]|nr:hypothetical protein [Lachnospiraceae bacterium]